MSFIFHITSDPIPHTITLEKPPNTTVLDVHKSIVRGISTRACPCGQWRNHARVGVVVPARVSAGESRLLTQLAFDALTWVLCGQDIETGKVRIGRRTTYVGNRKGSVAMVMQWRRLHDMWSYLCLLYVLCSKSYAFQYFNKIYSSCRITWRNSFFRCVLRKQCWK